MPKTVSGTYTLLINVSSGLMRSLSSKLRSPSFLLKGVGSGKRVNGFKSREVLVYFHSISTCLLKPFVLIQITQVSAGGKRKRREYSGEAHLLGFLDPPVPSPFSFHSVLTSQSSSQTHHKPMASPHT